MNSEVNSATCEQCRSIFLREDAAHLMRDSRASGVELCTWVYTRQALEKSVQAGCPLCLAFQERFHSQYSKLEQPYENGDVDELRLSIRMDMAKPRILGIRAAGSGDKNYLSYQLLAKADDPAAANVLGRFPQRNVLSQRTFEVARRFISTCDTMHPNCVKLGNAKLPTRVIAVSPTNNNNNNNNPAVPYVYTTNGAVARYAALSYCWGYDPDCKTTKATLAAHSTALLLEKLPQTILDAITVTRELGIAYLWVDSLCIVQDDVDDMATELAGMVDIYRGAYFTISAASTADSRDGFLSDRTLTSIVKGKGPIYLPYRVAAGPDGPVGMVGLVKNSIRDVVRDPIHSRAWTMQEHFLAPRLLVYGSVQLFCICSSETLQCGDQYSLGNWMDRRHWQRTHQLLSPSQKVTTEVPGVEVPKSSDENETVRFGTLEFMFSTILDSTTQRTSYEDNPLEKIILDMVLCRLLAEIIKGKTGKLDDKGLESMADIIQQWSSRWTFEYGHKAPQDVRNRAGEAMLATWELIRAPSSSYVEAFAEFPHIWKGIVEEFTSRQLTHHADKLPALAAITEVVGSSVTDEYIVGHWKKYFLPQLLWRVANPATTSRPAPQTLAHHPTWSWTSVDGQIEMWPFHFENPAKTSIAEVLECTTELAHDIVLYGRVKSSKLDIRGWLQPIVLDAMGKTAKPRRRTSQNDAPIDIHLDDCRRTEEIIGGAKKNIKWSLALVKLVPVLEWGIGKEDTARAIAGLVLDITGEGAKRIGTFSGHCTPLDSGGISYGDASSLSKRFSWLLSGSRTIVSLI